MFRPVIEETAHDRLARRAGRAIARIDERISAQVDRVIHHPKFQRLEARWRSLWSLVGGLPRHDERTRATVRVLSVSWAEVRRDFRHDWEASLLFDKIYAQRFGMPGGQPFGLLVGDFEFQMRPQDLFVLRSFAQIAAAAFAPFVAAAHPSLVGLDDDFAELGNVFDLEASTRLPRQWTELRKHPDARFVALTLPRVLARPPHDRGYSATTRVRCEICGAHVVAPASRGCRRCRDGGRTSSERIAFCYRERAERRSDYLWANGAFSVARVALRCFLQTGWHVDLFGMAYGEASGRGRLGRGLLNDVPCVDPGLEPSAPARVAGVEVAIGAWYERELVELGFVPIVRTPGRPEIVVASTPTIQRPEPPASVSARMASMLHYVLCLSRIAHCLKVMARDRIGGVTDAVGLERILNAWVNRYVSPNDHADDEIRARFPLREARVTVRARFAEPGVFECVLRVRPHAQLDDVAATMRLQAASPAVASTGEAS